MKELNPLESRLRSWTLRPPSERVRARLFGKENPATVKPARPVWPWLAPVTAALFVSVMVVSQNRHGLTYLGDGAASSHVATALLTSPYLASALYVESPHSERNAWSKATFEWTNRSHALSGLPTRHDTQQRAPLEP